MLALVAGIYDYMAFSSHYQLFLLDDGSYVGTFDSGRFMVVPGQIVFTSSEPTCGATPGIYQWSMDGTVLQFTAVNEGCKNRKIILEGRSFEQVPHTGADLTVDWVIKPLPFNFVNVDSQGNIYMTADGAPGFSKYDLNGALVDTWNDSALTFPTGIAADDLGNVYVANFDDATVHKYDPNGQPLLQWKVAGGEIGPAGLAVDSGGNLYVALHRLHDHYIEKYDPQGDLLGTWAPYGDDEGQILAGGRSGPSAIGVDTLGNTFISDDRGLTNKYDLTGNFVYSIGFALGAVDEDGNLYTVDKAGMNVSGQNLLRFDNTGKPTGQWSLPFRSVVVAIGPDGSLVMMGDNTIIQVKLPTP
jgi:Uncharacterized conserved protein